MMQAVGEEAIYEPGDVTMSQGEQIEKDGADTAGAATDAVVGVGVVGGRGFSCGRGQYRQHDHGDQRRGLS